MTKSSNIRILLLGCGSMGKNHWRLLQETPGIQPVGVVDPNEAVRNLVGPFAYYKNLEEVNPADYDAVVVATPINAHFEQGVQILQSQKHLLMEKPLATNSNQAQVLMDLAKEQGQVLLTGHSERFNPAFLAFQKHLGELDLGRIFRYEFHRIGPYPGHPGDFGVVQDLAVHDFDLFYQLSPPDIESCYFQKSRQFHPDHEDGFLANFTLKDNASAFFNINWLSPRKQRFIRVYGEHGMLECNLFQRQVHFFESKLRRSRPDDFGIHGIEYGETVELDVQEYEPLRAEIEYFRDLCNGQLKEKAAFSQGTYFSVEMVEQALQTQVYFPSFKRKMS